MKNMPALDDITQLRSLGTNETDYRYEDPSSKMLEVFPNRHLGDGYLINLRFPEFTSLCPKTGQPDFAEILVQYVPGELCLESKSIKLYFFAYRNFGAFMESITNKILRDMVEACQPKSMTVIGDFAPRGALRITVQASYDETLGFNVHRTSGEVDGQER